ncbi:hypothetical protein GGR34_003703 [Microvirga flocculans]|uniref:Uncharacterized protein n=1 Tax=Microvirga flocculans TaxID=217168 RepID=A0A7W6NA11_9HYPH|nr:hypothetical protein [Microvirga flocculans]MBB4042018.1 hypothetical protein [Microvirga flocculans]
MPTFAQAWPSAREKLDTIFGRSVQIVPMIENQRLGAQPDPARAPRTIQAKFTLKPGTDSFQGNRKGSEMEGFGSRQVAQATLAIRAAVYAAIGYRLRRGDHVVIASGHGAGRYSLAKDPPSHLGDHTLDLIVESQP